jgi:antitoxin ParD1/3/4
MLLDTSNGIEKECFMTVLRISLSDGLKEFVEAEVSERGYRTESEYIAALIKEAKKRKAKQKLETMLLAGLSSGDPMPVTEHYWETKHGRLARRRTKSKNQ